MPDALKKAYRYYFYRVYLFYLKKWNNKRGIALAVADISIASTMMFNVGTILMLLKSIFNIWILPDFKTHKLEVFIVFTILSIAYIGFNNKFIISRFDEIIEEFKNEDKKSFESRGWLIAAFDIGSFMLFAGFGLVTI